MEPENMSLSYDQFVGLFPPQPKFISGIDPERLPKKYRSLFLPGDLVLFRDNSSRFSAPAIPPQIYALFPSLNLSSPRSEKAAWMYYCGHCGLDKMAGFAILASLYMV